MPVARSILPPPTNQPAHLLTVIVSVRMASSQKQCRGPDLKMFLCHHRPTLPSSARIKGHLCCGLCHNRNGTSSTSAYGQHSNTAPPSSSSTPARQPRTSTSSTAAQQYSSSHQITCTLCWGVRPPPVGQNQHSSNGIPIAIPRIHYTRACGLCAAEFQE